MNARRPETPVGAHFFVADRRDHHMYISARITVEWTSLHTAHVTIDGSTAGDLVERLDRALDLVLEAHATCITVDVARMHGPGVAVLELLAATCHRLWNDRGCLHVVGLGRRLVSSPEVAAFPEVFGELRSAG